MTTIAYRDGVLASDSRITDDDGTIHSDRTTKIWRLEDGSMFGWSGETEQGAMVLETLQKGLPFPAFTRDPNIAALRVMPDGTILVCEGMSWFAWEEPYAAIGSGGKFALSAMKLGHDAVKAVHHALTMDAYSGGKVQKLCLK